MITENQLLEAILDAQNRCNNLVGAAFNEIRSEKRAKQESTDAWKKENPELASRCRDGASKLTSIFNIHLDRLLEGIDGIDELHSMYETRDFIDSFGLPLIQLHSVLSTLGSLSK